VVTPHQRGPSRDAVSDLGGDALVVTARDLAECLLGGSGRRWQHTEGVARRAERVAVAVPEDDRPALVAAAWLHDVGYAESLRRCSFHPLDGAFYLQETAWGAPLAGLVAHHSGARFVAAVRGLSSLMQQFPTEDYALGPLADALTYADQTIGPDGRLMDVEDRFADMLNRHGPDSPLAQAHPRRAPAIRAAAGRTERRLLVAGAGSVLIPGPNPQ
jgi:HD domain